MLSKPPPKRDPLLAPREIPMRHPLACDHYAPLSNHAFVAIYASAQFELLNLALFHRAAFGVALTRDRRLAASIQEHAAPEYDSQDEEAREWLERVESHYRTAVDVEAQEIAAIAGHADELTVVGLWALGEKHLSEALRIMTNREAPYRWDKLKSAFASFGIELASLPGYSGADECRLLNNAIKHSGRVTAPLAQSRGFLGRKGEVIRRFDLDLQTYLLCVHHLVGSTLELCDVAMSASSDAAPFRTDTWGSYVTADPTDLRALVSRP